MNATLSLEQQDTNNKPQSVVSIPVAALLVAS